MTWTAHCEAGIRKILPRSTQLPRNFFTGQLFAWTFWQVLTLTMVSYDTDKSIPQNSGCGTAAYSEASVRGLILPVRPLRIQGFVLRNTFYENSSPSVQGRSVNPPAMAGVCRIEEWTRQKL